MMDSTKKENSMSLLMACLWSRGISKKKKLYHCEPVRAFKIVLLLTCFIEFRFCASGVAVALMQFSPQRITEWAIEAHLQKKSWLLNPKRKLFGRAGSNNLWVWNRLADNIGFADWVFKLSHVQIPNSTGEGLVLK